MTRTSRYAAKRSRTGRKNSCIRLVGLGTVVYCAFFIVSLSRKERLLSPATHRAFEYVPSKDSYKQKRGRTNAGIVSKKDPSFFRKLQEHVDNDDPNARCLRYGGTFNADMNRRIFYGSLIADESTELLEIVAAESYGIYHAMVFVESNRTQNFTPRPLVWSDQTRFLKRLFHTNQVQVRRYVNETRGLDEMLREHLQRDEILKGWKDLGMGDDDIGLLADVDETFTRDFLRAVQTCDFDVLTVAKHDCNRKKVKLIAFAQVFESSPECLVAEQSWYHPDMMMGHCIEGISSHHPPAPRLEGSVVRQEGYGSDCSDWDIADKAEVSHSWNAADFRRTCGGRQVEARTGDPVNWNISSYTGFHFHNFFADAPSIRFKYRTYGHFDPDAGEKKLSKISKDLSLMVHCVKGEEDDISQQRSRLKEGFAGLKPPLPIYFHDPDYRSRRHEYMKQLVVADEETQVPQRRSFIPAGIEVTDPSLYTTVLTGKDTTNATVMGLASGYRLDVYQRFVGSLRKTGYRGHIILGVAPDIPKESLDYLRLRGVSFKVLSWVNCTYELIVNDNKPAQCAYPYSDIKTRWSRFPLARDWLMECATCTGPVLVMDARDSLFQRDPFADTEVKGLQVFQEHLNQTTQHWLAKIPIEGCKGVAYHETMLCSGTTIGTREAMLKYLDMMYEEMRRWIVDPKCRFKMNGDDQSIHNYLFYSGQLPFATSIPNRRGIVNTAGVEGAVLAKRHFAYWKQKEGLDTPLARTKPYTGANDRTWIGPEFNVANEDGLFTEFDGSVSRVVHQWDRYHFMYESWLKKQRWASDRFGENTVELDFRAKPSVALRVEGTHVDKVSKDRNSMAASQTDVGDASLSTTISTGADSTNATVMALASGYRLDVYQRFVGSLRKTGYKGHVILGVAPDLPRETAEYLQRRNVIIKRLRWVDCTYKLIVNEGKAAQCAFPYSDIKTRWSRFPLARDWLTDCATCTGPVLVMDARDSLFQRDPFANTIVTGLQVFQEHLNQTTQHWLAKNPIQGCKGVTYHETMLCSGTTIGTREAMLKYLDTMYGEMKRWIVDPKCRFEMNGDDQSIHNYLFYSGQLPFATSIPNRRGIVNTAGVEGATLAKRHFAYWKQKEGLEKPLAKTKRYAGANEKTWIGPEFNVANEDGLFTEFDGSVSRVVHQWDRYHFMYESWLEKQRWASDRFGEKTVELDFRAKPSVALRVEGTHVDKVSKDRKSMAASQTDVSDASLYTTISTGVDSTNATVMALASGYRLDVYQRFVGSLRKTGYKGHIILGVAPDVPRKTVEYLERREVVIKRLQVMNCTYKLIVNNGELAQCAFPYSDIKTRWSRFPLARDWLTDCSTCTGPVLVMDARDSLFQRDPFANTDVQGLQVFQEHKNVTTENWLTQWPISQCKNVSYSEPMLCSGTTIGTRAAMLKYLDIMYAEMKRWIVDPSCRFKIHGDDQSIHNYLFYSGQLPFANSIPNRHGGIVNTVGFHGSALANQHFAYWKENKGLEKPQAKLISFPGANERTWIGPKYSIADENGLFTDFDGNVSRVVHQWDRFHYMYTNWLDSQQWANDE